MTRLLPNIEELQTPVRQKNSTHVFHQYTLLVKNGKRDELHNIWQENGVPSMDLSPGAALSSGSL